MLLVAVGAGAVTRYLTAMLALRIWGDSFPWGTMIVNLAGCFAIGVIYAVGIEIGAIGPRARLFLITGLLGGLTTFSAFALETSALMMQGNGLHTTLNITGNVVGALLLFYAGIALGRMFY